MILASPRADQGLASKGIRLLREQLPLETQRVLEKAEQTGDFESEAYRDIVNVFYKKHPCRMEPFPPEELLPASKHLSEDTTVYETM